MTDLFRIKKTSFLGNLNKLKLHLEYLTKQSVKNDISKTSISLDNEYIIGIIEKLFFKNGMEIIFDRQ